MIRALDSRYRDTIICAAHMITTKNTAHYHALERLIPFMQFVFSAKVMLNICTLLQHGCSDLPLHPSRQASNLRNLKTWTN